MFDIGLCECILVLRNGELTSPRNIVKREDTAKNCTCVEVSGLPCL